MTSETDNAGSFRAADAIVAEIERRITTGQLEHGTPLPSERLLIEEFGTSRTVVREAITALSSRGLIECKPRFRPIVRQIGYENVIDATGPVVRRLLGEPGGVRNLYEARVFMERTLARDAATSASKDDIARLKAALAANHEAIDDSRRFYQADIAFHRVLYLIPRNPVFPAVHEGFVSWLAPQWEKMPRSLERNRQNCIAHEAIYNAILERDPDAAEAAIIAHLDDAWSFVKATFGD